MKLLSLVLLLTACGSQVGSNSSTPIGSSDGFSDLIEADPLDCTGARGGHILIIGDSISIQYGPHLTQALSGCYTVERIPVNARGTRYTLARIDGWLSGVSQAPDIIIWNNGLWNALKYDPTFNFSVEESTSLAEYSAGLRTIATKLTATGADVYFVSTTTTIDDPRYNSGREIAENDAALIVMSDFNIPFIDIHKLSTLLPLRHRQAAQDVHYNEHGASFLGRFIAREIINLDR